VFIGALSMLTMKVKNYLLSACMTLSTTLAGMTAGAVPFNVIATFADEVGGVKVELVQDSWSEILNLETEAEKKVRLEEEKEKLSNAQNIDKYFAEMNLPLAGYGETFVEVADKYDLDYRLLPAIAMRESTGGKHPCPAGNKNVFGWHSCKTVFKTYEEAIDKVGAHLAGEVKSTKSYYGNKSVRKKLRTYNSVIPPYVDQVISIMNKIEKGPIYESLAKIDSKDLKEVAVK
jgi:hypothetical protein